MYSAGLRRSPPPAAGGAERITRARAPTCPRPATRRSARAQPRTRAVEPAHDRPRRSDACDAMSDPTVTTGGFLVRGVGRRATTTGVVEVDLPVRRARALQVRRRAREGCGRARAVARARGCRSRSRRRPSWLTIVVRRAAKAPPPRAPRRCGKRRPRATDTERRARPCRQPLRVRDAAALTAPSSPRRPRSRRRSWRSSSSCGSCSRWYADPSTWGTDARRDGSRAAGAQDAPRRVLVPPLDGGHDGRLARRDARARGGRARRRGPRRARLGQRRGLPRRRRSSPPTRRSGASSAASGRRRRAAASRSCGRRRSGASRR